MPLQVDSSIDEMLRRQAERQKRVVVPEGDYWLRITSVKDAVSKKNNDMVVVDFDILDESGDKMSSVREYITEKTIEKAANLVKAAAMEDSWDPNLQVSDIIKGIKEEGRFVPARIKVEEYKDKEKNTVHFFIVNDEEEDYLA